MMGSKESGVTLIICCAKFGQVQYVTAIELNSVASNG